MDDESMRAAEKRGYSRGYAAGRRSVINDDKRKQTIRELAAANRAARRFRQQAFLAALTATITVGGWQTGKRKWTPAEDFARGCWDIAGEACRQNKEPFA